MKLNLVHLFPYLFQLWIRFDCPLFSSIQLCDRTPMVLHRPPKKRKIDKIKNSKKLKIKFINNLN